MRNTFKGFLTLFIFWFSLGGADAAQVLLKQLPGSVYSGAARELFGHQPHRWNGGFRTASTTNACYITGWTNGDSGGDDGLVAKVDATGGILWVRKMGTIMGSGNWQTNDIAIHGQSLYICGKYLPLAGGEHAFIAKLSLEGTIQDYCLIDGVNGASRANAIAVGSDNGQSVVTVVGDAWGDKLSVRERQRNGGGTVFDGLSLQNANEHPTQRDVFIVSFDTYLRAVWSTTLGNDFEGNCYATAVEADNTGALFVGMVMDEAATAGGVETTRQIFRGHAVGNREVYYRNHDGVQVRRALGIEHHDPPGDSSKTDAYGNDFDPHVGSVSAIYRIKPRREGTGGQWKGQEITHHFLPCKLEGGEVNSHSRVTDIVYTNGSLFVAGEWQKHLMPVSSTQSASTRIDSKSTTNDIWVAKLVAGDLKHEAWRIYGSTGQDYASSLTVGGDSSVYLAGIAGGALKTRTLTDSSESDPSGPLASNSSKAHLFWQKLTTANLNPAANWHVTPLEASGIEPPGSQKACGTGVIGDTVIITGAWTDGSLVMGPDAARRKALPHVQGAWLGFAGFLNQSGSFLEEVEIKINSDHGITPQPHLGVNTVAGGKTIVASVPQEVFKDSSGNIISADDSENIRKNAVTRHVCIGYQFKASEVNGTANRVTFVANSDTELTFLWRTDHAVEIESDLSGTDGLTSTAAGNPDPLVQKHWIKENSQFAAQIDGAEQDAAVPGTRWRSTGFIAEGCVATAQGVASGSLVKWPKYHPRLQTNKITVGAPGKIVWQWQKEHSVRVGVNSTLASSAPCAYSEATLTPLNREPDQSFHRHFGLTGIDFNHLVIVADNADASLNPTRLKVARHDGSAWVTVMTIDLPPLARNVPQCFPLPGTLFGISWQVLALNPSGAVIPTNLSSVRLGRNIESNGEYWFNPHTNVTVTSRPEVSSGTSTLVLKGYTGGQGSVTPFSQSGVTLKTFPITQPSNIVWDYARAIYPETVTIGDAVTFSGVTGADASRINKAKAPQGGSVLQGRSGSSWSDMQQWDQVAHKLYPLRPGKFTVEFENTAAPTDAAQNIIVEVTAQWPPTAHYTHIVETPPVDLDPSSSDGLAFQKLAYSESEAAINGVDFTAQEDGKSVLLFSQRAEGAATGTLTKESLAVKVVDSILWRHSAGSSKTMATIGEAIVSNDHVSAVVGHNGFVIDPLSPVNASLYDRSNLSGPILPVNETAPVSKISNGLIAHLPLSETSGTTATEAISGTLTTYSSSTPSWNDPGVDFSNTHFRTQPSVGNGITDRLTLSAIIKADSFASWDGIITKGENKAPYTLGVWETGQLVFSSNVFSPSGRPGMAAHSTTVLNRGQCITSPSPTMAAMCVFMLMACLTVHIQPVSPSAKPMMSHWSLAVIFLEETNVSMASSMTLASTIEHSPQQKLLG